MLLYNHGLLYIVGALLMYIMSFVTFIIGIKFKNRHVILSHLFIYPFASFLQITFSGLFDLLGFNISSKNSGISIHIFIIIEIICIYIFFMKTNIITGLAKKILPFFLVGFFLLYLTLWIRNEDLIKKSGRIYFWESCFILLPCFIYLYQLFVKPPTLNLLNEPSFWFTAGILIYLTLSLPTFLMIDYFQNKSIYDLVNLLNFIGYCIIFSFLIKAYLCKPPKTI